MNKNSREYSKKLLIKVARAFHHRPNDVLNWDFHEEYMPAVESVSESPLVEDMLSAFFLSKKKGSRIRKKLNNKEERKKAFENLKKQQKEWSSNNARQ